MPGKAKAIPEGYHTVTPHLVVRDAARAIEFYKQAFGAQPRRISYGPDGKTVMHADLKIGDSVIMLADECPPMKVLSPASLGGSPVMLHIYIEDVDRAFNQAAAAGATITMPVMDMFWGDRYGQLVDPFGHKWSMATHQQDLTQEQIEEGGKAAYAKMGQQAQHGS